MRGKALALVPMVGFASYALGPGIPAYSFTPRTSLALAVTWASMVLLPVPLARQTERLHPQGFTAG